MQEFVAEEMKLNRKRDAEMKEMEELNNEIDGLNSTKKSPTKQGMKVDRK